jgi:hypothetical protein
LALGAGEVADTSGLNDAYGQVGGLESLDDGLFIAAGGFTDHMSSGLGPEEFEELGMTFGVIG